MSEIQTIIKYYSFLIEDIKKLKNNMNNIFFMIHDVKKDGIPLNGHVLLPFGYGAVLLDIRARCQTLIDEIELVMKYLGRLDNEDITYKFSINNEYMSRYIQLKAISDDHCVVFHGILNDIDNEK